jgi:hypothetical protein
VDKIAGVPVNPRTSVPESDVIIKSVRVEKK